MKSRYLLYILMLCSLFSCMKDDETMDAIPSADFIRSTDIVVEATDTQADLIVEANCRWSLSTQSEWLILGSNNGEGTSVVTLTMSKNESPNERSAELTLVSATGISRQLTVLQKGDDYPMPGNDDNLRPTW